MTDSIGDILGAKHSNEPPEFAIIKRYVRNKFDFVPTLKLGTNTIIINVPNSGIANVLRFELHKIQKLCQTTRKLMIRIGSQ